MRTLPVLFIFALPTVSTRFGPSHVTRSPSRIVAVANPWPLRHVLEVTVYRDTLPRSSSVSRANTGIETRLPFPCQNPRILSVSVLSSTPVDVPGDVLTWPRVTHSQISGLSSQGPH